MIEGYDLEEGEGDLRGEGPVWGEDTRRPAPARASERILLTRVDGQ